MPQGEASKPSTTEVTQDTTQPEQSSIEEKSVMNFFKTFVSTFYSYLMHLCNTVERVKCLMRNMNEECQEFIIGLFKYDLFQFKFLNMYSS